MSGTCGVGGLAPAGSPTCLCRSAFSFLTLVWGVFPRSRHAHVPAPTVVQGEHGPCQAVTPQLPTPTPPPAALRPGRPAPSGRRAGGARRNLSRQASVAKETAARASAVRYSSPPATQPMSCRLRLSANQSSSVLAYSPALVLGTKPISFDPVLPPSSKQRQDLIFFFFCYFCSVRFFQI